jgi:hypothetical protein
MKLKSSILWVFKQTLGRLEFAKTSLLLAVIQVIANQKLKVRSFSGDVSFYIHAKFKCIRSPIIFGIFSTDQAFVNSYNCRFITKHFYLVNTVLGHIFVFPFTF